ncbi:hypothetical protein EW145_g987 [Phellinidium pouzarii]|uniref:Uncharacterized protein n=1 Tax=Phellinidium pouzarii TaxID=167371 RepID=A0A4S4LGD6_9AGAM|nr:hypothetical protein EW145_g987 [Phellinidium pouzarii]
MSFKCFHLYALLFKREDCLSYSLLLGGSSVHDCTLYHCVPRFSSDTNTNIGWSYCMTEHVDLILPPWPIVLIVDLADLDGFERAAGSTARLVDRMLCEDGQRKFPATPPSRTFDGFAWFKTALHALSNRCILSVDFDGLKDEIVRATPGALSRFIQGRSSSFITSQFCQ